VNPDVSEKHPNHRSPDIEEVWRSETPPSNGLDQGEDGSCDEYLADPLVRKINKYISEDRA